MFNKSNLPKLDSTRGKVLKTRPMLGTLILEDTKIPAPWGGELQGLAGVDMYMIQAMENEKGKIDAYFNKVPQAFGDYHVIGPKHESGPDKGQCMRAEEMSKEALRNIFDDLPQRLEHIQEFLNADARVWVMQRTQANQTLLGRAEEAGTFETDEGPVEFDVGAFINQDNKGRVWPIDVTTFGRDYKLL